MLNENLYFKQMIKSKVLVYYSVIPNERASLLRHLSLREYVNIEPRMSIACVSTVWFG